MTCWPPAACSTGGGELAGTRGACRGDGQAPGEDGLEQALRHLPGLGVPVGQQQHGSHCGLVQRSDLAERAAAGEVHMRPPGDAGPFSSHPVAELSCCRSEVRAERAVAVVLVADIQQWQLPLRGGERGGSALSRTVSSTGNSRVVASGPGSRPGSQMATFGKTRSGWLAGSRRSLSQITVGRCWLRV